MERQQVHLLRRLDAHEAHRRPLHGFGDRFGVAIVVLVALEERLSLRDSMPHRAGARPGHPISGPVSKTGNMNLQSITPAAQLCDNLRQTCLVWPSHERAASLPNS